MTSGAIWIPDQKVLDRFNHFKIDNGKKPALALKKLLDIAEGKKEN